VEKSPQTQPSVETKRKSNKKTNTRHLTMRGNYNVLAHFPTCSGVRGKKLNGKVTLKFSLEGVNARRQSRTVPSLQSTTRFSRRRGDDGKKWVAVMGGGRANFPCNRLRGSRERSEDVICAIHNDNECCTSTRTYFYFLGTFFTVVMNKDKNKI